VVGRLNRVGSDHLDHPLWILKVEAYTAIPFRERGLGERERAGITISEILLKGLTDRGGAWQTIKRGGLTVSF
jgi:hypothetical protein